MLLKVLKLIKKFFNDVENCDGSKADVFNFYEVNKKKKKTSVLHYSINNLVQKKKKKMLRGFLKILTEIKDIRVSK